MQSAEHTPLSFPDGQQCSERSQACIITKKPLSPKLSEIKKNPRSRSAKLRAAKKI